MSSRYSPRTIYPNVRIQIFSSRFGGGRGGGRGPGPVFIKLTELSMKK